MATYDAKTLYDKWKRDELTHEQAIGHLVQRLLEVELRLQVLERKADSPPQSDPGGTPHK